MRTLPILALIASLSATGLGETWIVAIDGSGDFFQIQPAIDAAADGDLIFVKPGTYDSFVLGKPLSIVGSGVDQTTVTDAGSPDGAAALLLLIPDGEVLLASLSLVAECPIGAGNSPETKLVLWNIRSNPNSVFACVAAAASTLESLYVGRFEHVLGDGDSFTAEGASGLAIQECPVAFVVQSSFQAADQAIFGTYRGGSGIRIAAGTTAYIAETSAIGGSGGHGYLGWDCVVSHKGGPGGSAVYLAFDHGLGDPSLAYIYDRPSHTMRAGPGGSGERYGGCPEGPGGDGGDGIWAEWGNVYYAGVQPRGGEAGIGDPPGAPGNPTRGSVVQIPQCATSTVEGEGQPGTTVTFWFYGTPGDRLLIAYSNEIDVVDVPGTDGHPLIASPKGSFQVIPGGTIRGSGKISHSFEVPEDAPVGQPFYVQGIVLGDHPPEITNMSMIVVTPKW